MAQLIKEGQVPAGPLLASREVKLRLKLPVHWRIYFCV